MEPNPQTDNKESLPPIRTYQSDVEELLKRQNGSLAKIAVAEEDRRARIGYAPEDDVDRKRSMYLVAGALLFILIGLGSVGGVIYVFRQKNAPPEETGIVFSALISADSEGQLDITGKKRAGLLQMLTAEKNRQGKVAQVSAYRLTTRSGEQIEAVSAADFLSELDVDAPDVLFRALQKDFIFGTYALRGSHPFFLFKVGDYQNAFSGMLQWEQFMTADLGPLFIPTYTPATRAATTTEDIFRDEDDFVDIVYKNRDIRALKDAAGSTVLLYSFPDKNTLIITTNEITLEEILKRIIAGKLIR